MDHFDMKAENEPVMGISDLAADRIWRAQTAHGMEFKTRIDSAVDFMEERLIGRMHYDADEDDRFFQIVPCVMVQGIPHRMIRTIQGDMPGYDSGLISICAHSHIQQGISIRDTVNGLLRNKLHIEPEQVWNKVIVGFNVPNEKPGYGKHLMIMYAYRVIDFAEREEDIGNGASLKWVNLEELRRPQNVERFDPWCQHLYPYMLTVAEATARDITMRFFMEGKTQRMEIRPGKGA